MDQNFFAAFISYSSPDTAFAKHLQEWLERFQDEHSGSVVRLRPVFRDTSELAASEDLFQSICKELEVSRAVIVICSRHAAKSKWVDRELRHFRSVKPDGLILAILAPGTSYRAEDLASFLPSSLLPEQTGGRELLIANTDSEGQQTAFMRLAAGLLGVRYSVLADRHAEREREIRRQRSRLAAKTHTLPAETAFLRGNVELAVKHALSAILEGDDSTWGEAPELESTVAEYVMRYRDKLRYWFEADSGNPVIIDNAIVAAGRLLIAGTRNGRILMADAQTGEIRRVFSGEMIWQLFENAYPNSDAHRWLWFRQAWDPAHPIGLVVESPSREHLIMTHGATATSWKVSDCSATGLFLGGGVYNLFAFAQSQPLAALADDAGRTTTRITLINYETGDFVGSDLGSWEPLDMAFSAGPWGEQLVMVSRKGTLDTLDPGTAELVDRRMLYEDRLLGARFLHHGRALRLNGDGFVHSGGKVLPPRYFERGEDGEWRPADDPMLSSIEAALDYRIPVYSPDETRAYAYAYDEKNGRVLLSSEPGQPPVELAAGGRDATFSPDGSKLVTRSDQGAVDLIDAVSGERISHLQKEGFAIHVSSMGYSALDRSRGAWSADSRLVALSYDKVRPSTSIEELMLDLHDRSLFPQSLAVHDAQTGRVVSNIGSLGEQIDLVGFTPESDGVWVLKNKHDLRLVRIGEPRLLWTSLANQGVDELAVDPTGATVAAVEGFHIGQRKIIRLMSAESGETVKELDVGSDAWRLHFRDAAELIVSCGDGTVRLYGSEEAKETRRFRDHVKKSSDEEVLLDLMEAADDGGVIVTATGEDTVAPVVARDLRSNARKRVTKSTPAAVQCIAVTPDGEKLAYSDAEGESFVIQRSTGKVLVQVEGPTFALKIAIDEARSRVIVLGRFGELEIFDLETGEGEPPHTIKLLNQEYGLETGILLPARNLAVVAEERLVQIVELDSKKAMPLQSADGFAIPPIAASPDGSLVAAASPDAAVRLWRTSDGRRVSILRQHRSAISALCFTPNGRRLISADEQGVVCAWDVSDAYLRGHALTQWIQSRIAQGLLVLNKLDNENLLLQDVLSGSESRSRDLMKALDRFAPNQS